MLWHVVWEIDLDADTASETAQPALNIQHEPSLATVFDVTSEDGTTTRHDLSEEEQHGT